MRDEHELRELLGAVVPEAPVAPGRAAGAKGYAARARRRRAVAFTASAGVVVAVVVSVPFIVRGAMDDAGDGRPGLAPATQIPAFVASDVPCPPTPGRDDPPLALTGPGTVADGAAAVRLCDPRGLFGQPPLDALVTDADAVARAVNDLPVADECTILPADLGSTWLLQFTYPDGQTQHVRGQSHGCGGVTVGQVIRGGRDDSTRPLRMFQRLLWEQRSATELPAAEVPGPRCDDRDFEHGPGLTIMPLEEPLTATEARLCWSFETESQQPVLGARIAPADVAVLLADLNQRRPVGEITEDECVDPEQPHYRIVGVNAWGDRFELDGYCGVFDLSGSNSDIWRPDAASQTILDRLVADNPAVILDPDDRTPPDQVLSVWADLVNSGMRARADALWLDPPALSDGIRVEMKTEGQRTVTPEPGTAAAAYDQVVEVGALFRLVPSDGSWADYHQGRFTLGRDTFGDVWRIVAMVDDGAVSTGR
jgi:hypothetical protein